LPSFSSQHQRHFLPRNERLQPPEKAWFTFVDPSGLVFQDQTNLN
jgi:hypothetical protein